MSILEPAGEWLRLAEHYRALTDGELLALARRPNELTQPAQQALAQEMSTRRLKVSSDDQDEASRSAPPLDIDEDDPYAEDRELVELCKVWSIADANKVQRLLDVAGIPFYMGPENATLVDFVTSSFPSGVSVRVMRIGLPLAWEALTDYVPADEPEAEKPQTDFTVTVECPVCRSTDVILQNMTEASPAVPAGPASAPGFNWLCVACGRQWQDDGIVK